jgi:hypothetical protein
MLKVVLSVGETGATELAYDAEKEIRHTESD